jgi:GTP-binding protein
MQHFVDEVIINVSSGHGGPGCVSFRREKFIPYGGPNGGDGGDGGSVIFRVKQNVRTLYHLKLKKNFRAKNGQQGMGSQCSGKKGEDVIIDVPQGTVIYDVSNNEILKDFTQRDEIYVFLKGGKGGMGNMHFATSTNQAPRYAQPGLPGKEMIIRVELKLIADVGLVGFPNAGKSTLLSILTKARPKIANYPFTTLIPNLGVFTVDDESFVMADIPGIIDGASEGHGLGIQFLKHIERTKILLFIINLEDENYLDQYKKLKKELKSYSIELSRKKYIIAANKYDIADSEERFLNLKLKIKEEIIPISALTHYNVNRLLYSIKDLIHQVENENKK